MIIELHSIHSFPPASMNRDEHGDPKTTVYGGVRRARVSSQALKRPARMMLNDRLTGTPELSQGIRSRDIPAQIITNHLTTHADDPRAAKAVEQILQDAGLLHGKELVFLSRWEIAQIGELLADSPEFSTVLDGQTTTKTDEDADADGGAASVNKTAQKAARTASIALAKKVTQRLSANRVEAADIAAFGRMLAGARHLDVEAAVQVAHAIGVTRVERETDFFTAVDDLAQDDDAKASVGLLEQRGFNATVFYRYAAIDVRELARNLTGQPLDQLDATQLALVKRLAFEVADCLILAVPTAGKTQHAHQTRAATVFATVTTGMPCSLAGAFEKPIGYEAGNEDSITDRATRKLLAHHQQIATMYGEQAAAAAVATLTPIDPDTLPAGVQAIPSIEALLSTISTTATTPEPATTTAV